MYFEKLLRNNPEGTNWRMYAHFHFLVYYNLKSLLWVPHPIRKYQSAAAQTKISWVQGCPLCLLVKNIPMRIHKWFEPIVWPAHTDTALSLLANRSLQGGWSICLNLCVAKHTQENANFLRSYFWLALLVLIFEAVWFLGILLVSPQ